MNDAASCGLFVFPETRSIVLATTDADWHGDGQIKLVADIPTSDLDSFKQLSKLPQPTPGAPEGWIESMLKQKDLAHVLRSGKPEDFQKFHQDMEDSPSHRSRGAVVQKIDGGKSRIYIDLTCF